MRAFDDCRVVCLIVSDPCGAGDTVPTPLTKVIFIIGGDDEYTAMAGMGLVFRLLVALVLLFACSRWRAVLVVE